MRKLATAALGFAAAVFAAHYFAAYEYILIAGAVFAVVSLTGLLFRGNLRRRIFIVTLSLASGFIWSFIYTALFAKPYWQLHEETISAVAVVTDYPVKRQPRGFRVDVSVRDAGPGAAGARIYYYNEQELKPGNTIRFTGKFYRTDINDDGERYDALPSRGIFLSSSVSGDIEVINSGSAIHLMPKQLAAGIADKVSEIYPDDISPFMKALLTGKRDDLYNDTSLNSALSASGIIHIVAVSGMHVSFLMGFLATVIKNKKLFALYAIPVLFVFMAMTGFTPAVTRAGVMQIFLICAPLFKRESDSITSLSAAMILLLAVNPYACASVGLQLSFCATAGIIIFTSRINNAVTDFMRSKKIYKKKIPKTIIKYTVSSLSVTIGALIFTLPLTVVHFGYFSLIAPLTNLLTIGVVSFVFPMGLLGVALGYLHPVIGTAAGFPVRFAVRYIITVARIFASVPYSVVYLSSAHILFWLAYNYVMFITLPLLKARIRQYIYPVCISMILLFAVILTSILIPAAISASDTVTVVDVGQGLSVAACVKGRTIVIDCGSSSTNKAGEITHEYLQSAGCTSVDLLIITHFHDDHINGVEFLLSTINVSALAIPDPEHSYAAEDIIELARKKGTDIMYVTETLNIAIGESEVMIYPPLGTGDENERGISVLLMSDVTALITGDMNSAVERALLRYADLPPLDLLVAGHHGSRESTSEELLNALRPDIAVIPVGKNSFGHPHTDTLRRLESAGVTVYRTDDLGHVTVRGRN